MTNKKDPRATLSLEPAGEKKTEQQISDHMYDVVVKMLQTTMPTLKHVVEDPSKITGCDRCSKRLPIGEMFASCTDCSDTYCSKWCTLQMGSMETDVTGKMVSCLCDICNDDLWPDEE